MNYGVIGNCKTAALIHESGSIDWCCLPNFDSPSVFARLLDPKGGRFAVTLDSQRPVTTRQEYLPDTNILRTEFDDGDTAFALIDFMPRYREGSDYRHPLEIHRILRPLKGISRVRVSFFPRLNYARGDTKLHVLPGLLTAVNRIEHIYLYSSLPLRGLAAGEPLPLEHDSFLLLTYHEKIAPPTLTYVTEMFEKTQSYWEGWSRHCRLPSITPEAVLRAALGLKLLSFEDTGAIIAAATTSLPESLHEQRNWDYRYCWLRDSSLMLEALKSIGHFEEARAFIHFLLNIFESKQSKIQILYGIHGETRLTECVLPHLAGYKNSKPVRIGNGAYNQKQNDIYGEVLNAIYLYFFHYGFERMTEDVWSLVKFIANTAARQWKTADAGIWEYRHRRAHFTSSKVLSWVAMDRGQMIADKLGKKDAARRWRATADKICQNIEAKGWNESIQSYVQVYGSEDVDASLLLMNRYRYLSDDNPRWISTVRRCREKLLKNGYGFRYVNPDDFGKPKSAFIVATLWIAKALLSIGEYDEAFRIYEETLRIRNHVGLLSEDVDPKTNELLGNFPQAYSLMAVINTAHALQKPPAVLEAG